MRSAALLLRCTVRPSLARPYTSLRTCPLLISQLPRRAPNANSTITAALPRPYSLHYTFTRGFASDKQAEDNATAAAAPTANEANAEDAAATDGDAVATEGEDADADVDAEDEDDTEIDFKPYKRQRPLSAEEEEEEIDEAWNMAVVRAALPRGIHPELARAQLKQSVLDAERLEDKERNEAAYAALDAEAAGTPLATALAYQHSKMMSREGTILEDEVRAANKLFKILSTPGGIRGTIDKEPREEGEEEDEENEENKEGEEEEDQDRPRRRARRGEKEEEEEDLSELLTQNYNPLMADTALGAAARSALHRDVTFGMTKFQAAEAAVIHGTTDDPSQVPFVAVPRMDPTGKIRRVMIPNPLKLPDLDADNAELDDADQNQEIQDISVDEDGNPIIENDVEEEDDEDLDLDDIGELDAEGNIVFKKKSGGGLSKAERLLAEEDEDDAIDEEEDEDEFDDDEDGNKKKDDAVEKKDDGEAKEVDEDGVEQDDEDGFDDVDEEEEEDEDEDPNETEEERYQRELDEFEEEEDPRELTPEETKRAKVGDEDRWSMDEAEDKSFGTRDQSTILTFLTKLKLQDYAEKFFSMQNLLHTKSSELKEMGMTVKQRKSLLRQLDRFKLSLRVERANELIKREGANMEPRDLQRAVYEIMYGHIYSELDWRDANMAHEAQWRARITAHREKRKLTHSNLNGLREPELMELAKVEATMIKETMEWQAAGYGKQSELMAEAGLDMDGNPLDGNQEPELSEDDEALMKLQVEAEAEIAAQEKAEAEAGAK